MSIAILLQGEKKRKNYIKTQRRERQRKEENGDWNIFRKAMGVKEKNNTKTNRKTRMGEEMMRRKKKNRT